MFEYFRVPFNNLHLPEIVENVSAEAINAVEVMKGNVKPVIVSKIGMNKETYEMEYKVLHNSGMAVAIFANRLENVSCIVIDEKDLETVKKMF